MNRYERNMKQLYFQLGNPFWNLDNNIETNSPYRNEYTIYIGVPYQNDVSLRDYYHSRGWKLREYRIIFPKHSPIRIDYANY